MAICRYVTGIKLSQMTVATLVGLTFFQPVSYTRMAYLTYQYDIQLVFECIRDSRISENGKYVTGFASDMKRVLKNVNVVFAVVVNVYMCSVLAADTRA